MKILVIGGMHGNEPLGIQIVELLQSRPVKNVKAIYANKKAIAANKRFANQDLNRCFPGDLKNKEYEPRRAAQLLAFTKNYDLVLDFHNTYCPYNDCCFVGDRAEQTLYQAAQLLGLDKVIIADYECINKFASNCLSVEISLSSLLNTPGIWYERIKILCRLRRLTGKPDIQTYRFVYRMTLEDKANYHLAKQNMRAFTAINPNVAKKLGVNTPAYPIFINDKFTPDNYGGLLNKID